MLSCKYMKTTFFSIVAALGFTASIVAADSTTAPNYKQALSSVSVLEMPAKAAVRPALMNNTK